MKRGRSDCLELADFEQPIPTQHNPSPARKTTGVPTSRGLSIKYTVDRYLAQVADIARLISKGDLFFFVTEFAELLLSTRVSKISTSWQRRCIVLTRILVGKVTDMHIYC